MVAIDLEIRNRKSLSAINSNNDNRLYIEGSSHSTETHSQLLSLLKNKKIDLLFIDGDHSYEGVKKDFDLYKSSVSKNGIIAFHDIVPDSFLGLELRQVRMLEKFKVLERNQKKL